MEKLVPQNLKDIRPLGVRYGQEHHSLEQVTSGHGNLTRHKLQCYPLGPHKAVFLQF
jgi:hypothetical protein